MRPIPTPVHDTEAVMESFLTEDRLLALAKQPDTADNFEARQREIVAAFAGLTDKYCVKFKPRVVFYLPNGAILAHAACLHTFLIGHRKIGSPFEIFVISGTALTDEFYERFRDTVEHKHLLYFFGDNPVKKWLEIQAFCAKANMDAFVHVSHIQGMAFAAGIRCAKKHIWWSMKWHGECPGIDGYIDGANGFGDTQKIRKLRGALWETTYTALPSMLDASKTARAEEIRRTFAAKILYCVMARDEKYSEEFITACNRIAETPGAAIIYASRRQIPRINGRHIGWVDTAMWSQVADIYLDPFPFPGGLVTNQIIAARKPIVLMRCSGLDQTFFAAAAAAAGVDTDAATSIDEYVAKAKAYATQRPDRWVNAYADFQHRTMHDDQRGARDLVEAISRATMGAS